MKKIEIAIACHKPSELPNNDLFVPVQVGSAVAVNRMNMEHDDSGDNISDKNASYCELTAQYWLWKNRKADYYGLCHYRRFLAFKETNAKRNLRNQIDSGILNDDSMERFGINDEAAMRKIIEKNDVIIGEEQKVPKLYTPRGNQRTAYQHWAAHDRALIMKDDLDLMLNILEEVSPEVGKSARKYLNSSHFLGFNCFILRRDLFFEMCEIEFEVLARLEKKVDTARYGQQLSRIYGFMGEIISSSYFYYLIQSKKYKIKRLPLVYFYNTDPIMGKRLGGGGDGIPILFNLADNNPLCFVVTWQSFLDTMNKETNYDVKILINGSCSIKNELLEMTKRYKNVNLGIIDAEAFRCMYYEKYNMRDTNTYKNLEDTMNYFPLLPLVPYILLKQKEVLVFDGVMVFKSSIDELWNEGSSSDKMIVATRGLEMLAKVNDIYKETEEFRIEKKGIKAENIFSSNVMIWDLEKARKKISEEKAINILRGIKNKLRSMDGMTFRNEVMCQIVGEDVDFVDQKWNVYYDSNAFLKTQLPYIPLGIFKELLDARRSPKIICMMVYDPWERDVNEALIDFWAVARKTRMYEIILNFGNDLAVYRSKHDNRSIMVRLFPVDGAMRGRMTKILPPGSKRNKTVKKFLGFLHLR